MNEVKRKAFRGLLTGFDELAGFQEIVSSLQAFSRFNIPPHLYRYRSCGKAHSFDDVENCRMTFASPEVYKDEHDSSIHDLGMMKRASEMILRNPQKAMAYFKMILDKGGVSEKGVEISQLRTRARGFLLCPEDLLERRMQAGQARMYDLCSPVQASGVSRKVHKIACLCENKNSEYMWKEYAEISSGYLVEYDSSSLLKMGFEFEQAPLILPVLYTNELPDTYILSFLSVYYDCLKELLDKEVVDGLYALETIKCLFCKLRKSFAVEEEWRVMIASLELESEDRFIFRRIKPCRLVAGRNMSASDKARLYSCAKQNDIPIHDQDDCFTDQIFVA